MYNDIYNLIANTIFESSSLTGYQDLVCTFTSTIAVLFVLSIPFIVVYRVIKMLVD